MIARRREMVVLDALEGLVEHLRTLREERKAVITISDGWPLYGPDRALARPLVDPKSGNQTTVSLAAGWPRSENRPAGNDRHLDDRHHQRRAWHARSRTMRSRSADVGRDSQRAAPGQHSAGANRANVSFYPIGPGGFADAYRSIMTGPARALGMMADITDGHAVVRAAPDGVGHPPHRRRPQRVLPSSGITRTRSRTGDSTTSPCASNARAFACARARAIWPRPHPNPRGPSLRPRQPAAPI